MERTASVTEILDDAEEVAARVLAPWGGLLWLSALPLRLLQIHLVDRLASLGAEAPAYGSHVRQICLMTTGALVVFLLARVVYVRACVLGLRSGKVPGREAWRIGAGPALTYLYVGLVLELLSLLTLPALFTLPLLSLLGGLAAATSALQTRPALVDPWRRLAKEMGHVGTLVAFLFLFGVAWLLVFANLYFAFNLGLWLAAALPGVDVPFWSALFTIWNRSFRLLLAAGTTVLVEPFWLAALTMYVQKSEFRHSGEDLRIAWQRLRAADAP
jgi:hypothetical protein